ncbi:MAG: hypothetical protein R3F13_17450 [Prosthecobacter sp.]
MSTMPLTLLNDFGDRFSPMLVKELRQGLRTRFFTAALLLFHSLIILLLASVLLDAPVQTVSGIFWGMAGLMLLVVLPLRAFNELNAESGDGTLDMLTLTSIPSSRILSGKWLALFSQSLLVAGSLLPYMVARYYFGGVEILREVVALIVLVLASGIITSALLAFSSQKSVLLRIALAGGVGFGAAPLGFFTAFLVSSSEADYMLREFFALRAWEQGAICGGIVVLACYVIWFFLVMGASRIAPPSENHSTRKRVIIFGAHLFLTIIGWLLGGLGHTAEYAMWVFVPLVPLTLLAAMDVLTEDMPRFPTTMAWLAGKGRAACLLGRVLHPGWASGVLFTIILCVLTMSVLGAVVSKASYWNWDDEFVVSMFLLLLAVFPPVLIRINRSNSFVNWWVVQVCMIGAGILLAIFCEGVGMRELGFIGQFTPITTLFGAEAVDWTSGDSVLQFGAGFAVLWMVAACVRAFLNFPAYAALENEVQQLNPPRHEPAE